MANGKFVTARKNHRCTFCRNRIYAGLRYWYEKVTPWDHPDNDGYFVMKAHVRCIKTWHVVGSECDWTFPDDTRWWTEMLALQWIRDKRNAVGLCCEHTADIYSEIPKATVHGRFSNYYEPQGKGGLCDGCAVRLERLHSFRRDESAVAS